MRRLKRMLTGMAFTMMILMSAGCGEEKIISEDYQIGNSHHRYANAVMKTDTGFYYSQGDYGWLSLHYYDAANGKNMYLCNKPECRHEGDEFCVATSEKYMVFDTILYSNCLYINVIEPTDSAYEYKLLRASLDGSSLEEVVTYLTVNKVEINPDTNPMIIHRNKAFLPYVVKNVNNQQIGYNGVAIYDLETGEVTYLGDKEGDLKVEKTNFCGYGDYMYFVTAEKYKKRLCRYSYADGSVEELLLERNFTGDYAIYDDDTIYFMRGNSELFIHNPKTGENTSVSVEEWYGIRTGENSSSRSGFCDLVSDGKYLYIGENGFLKSFSTTSVWIGGMEDGSDLDFMEISILDGEGNLVNEIRFSPKDVLGYRECFLLHFCGETIYMQTPKMMYECTREDFVAGEPEFKEVYPIDIRLLSIGG